jgi:hypothetical protein
MKNRHVWPLAFWLVIASAALAAPGGMFTYQGRLLDGGQPANGEYDLQFALSDAPLEAGYIGPTLNAAPVAVSNGLFTVALDFGAGVFDGSARWLEIGVRANGSSDPYTLLNPRQPITAAPYALYAITAGTANTGSGTNTTIQDSFTLAGTTNVVLYATNHAVVTTPPNTNVIVVSGAGIAAANGIYALQGTEPNLIYANASGMRLVYTPDDLDYVWQIIDPSGTALYGSYVGDLNDVNEWQAIGVTGPRPSAVSYAVNLVTNFMTQLAMTGARVPEPSLGNELYVNGAIGDDLFAQRGRPDLPYQTVYAALQNATTNDTVRVAPGVYSETPFRITLPPGLKLIGGGRRVTRIVGGLGAGNLNLSSSNVLSSFSTDFVISLGGYAWTYPAYGAATNTLLENIEAYGIGDVIYGSWWQGFRAVNCDFNSRSDCFADAQSADEGTNAVAELYNCRLFAGWHGIANFGRGQIRMLGGSIEARAGYSGACVYGWDTGQPGASIELSGVSLRCSSADGGVRPYTILNDAGSNCLITLKGMLVNAADVFGEVAYEGNLTATNLLGGLTTNIAILGPGPVTNTLCFTNGILMNIQ